MEKKLRVCLFGSYYTGYEVLQRLLDLSSRIPIEIVGVVSDNPDKPYCSPNRRFWQYGYTKEEASMVLDLAKSSNIATWNKRIKPLIKNNKIIHESHFQQVFENEWRPDVVYMAAFGQRIIQSLIDVPSYGFFNIHTSQVNSLNDWPKFGGADGFEQILDAKLNRVNVVLHEVVEQIDAGAAVCFSPSIPLFLEESDSTPMVLQLMQSCSKSAGMLVSSHLLSSVWPHFKNSNKLYFRECI